MYWAQKIDWCCIWNRSLITSFVYASGIIPGPSNSTGIKFLYLFIANHNTSEWEFLFPWHYYINISIYLILYYLCLYVCTGRDRIMWRLLAPPLKHLPVVVRFSKFFFAGKVFKKLVGWYVDFFIWGLLPPCRVISIFFREFF